MVVHVIPREVIVMKQNPVAYNNSPDAVAAIYK